MAAIFRTKSPSRRFSVFTSFLDSVQHLARVSIAWWAWHVSAATGTAGKHIL